MISKTRVENTIRQLKDAIDSEDKGIQFDAIALANRMFGAEIPAICGCYEETIDFSGTVTRNAMIISELLSEYLESHSSLSFYSRDYETRDKELNTLISESIELYGNNKKDLAVEKLWDAFERMKTFFTELDKKASVNKIVTYISNGSKDYISLYSQEFESLTKIGNEFRIRHHETNRIDIKSNEDYDFFFIRCLALITSVTKRLKLL